MTDIPQELRRLSELLAEASKSLQTLAQLFEGAAAAPAPSPAPAPLPALAPAPPPSAPPPPDPEWPELVRIAEYILAADATKSWHQDELCEAVRDGGPGFPQTEFITLLRDRGTIEIDAMGLVRLAPKAKPPEPRDEIEALADEIDRARPYLGELDKRVRTAQVANWAGRARRLQDVTPPPPDRAQALRDVFGRLTAITREMPCGWIDALWRDWTCDWDTYVAYHGAILEGGFAELALEKEQALQRGFLRGLVIPQRRVTSYEAHGVLAEALEILPADDAAAKAVIDRYGLPPEGTAPSPRRRKKPSEPSERPEPVAIAPEILVVTRGKRALIAGGQGAREEHRLAIERALQFGSLEWIFSERGQASAFNRLIERIRPGRYDLVLFLAAYSSHKSNAFVKACKEAQIPFVYVTGGYSVAKIAHEIREQIVERRHNVSP